MILLRAADRVASPWKNGLGVTREIAVHPAGATLDDFDWRVSMATVPTDGPFSHFPQTDRTLAVLSGRLALTIQGEPARELGPESAPITFHGDTPVEAELSAGPVTDLNVMTRRGRIFASLERHCIASPMQIQLSEMTLVLALSSGLNVARNGHGHSLAAFDAILASGETDDAMSLQPIQKTAAYVVRFSSTPF